MKYFFSILFLLAAVVLHAQLQVTIQPPPVNTLREKDVLLFTINNSLSAFTTVFFKIQVSDTANNEVLNIRSAVVQLPTGLSRFSYDNLSLTSINYPNDEVKQSVMRTLNFPSGIYNICVIAVDYGNKMETGSSCIEHTVKDASSADNKTGKKNNPLKGIVKVFGNGQLEGMYATRQGTGQQIPHYYFRADLRPGMDIGPVPLQLNVFYSTEESRTRQQQFIVNFRFDQDRFKSNLIKLVTEKLKLQQLSKLKDLSAMTGKLGELENYTKALKDPALLKDIESYKQLGNLKDELKGMNLNSFEELYDKLQQTTQKAATTPFDISIKAMEASLQNLKKIKPVDSISIRKQQKRIDSLDRVLQKTVLKRDSVVNALQKMDVPKEKAKALLDKYNKLKGEYGDLSVLTSRNGVFEKLTAKTAQLQKYKEYLESTGVLDKLKTGNSYDFSKLTNPDELKNQLKNFNLFSGANKLFFGVKGLAIGNVYPSYSPFTIDGIQLFGGSVEINPGLFYFSATAGQSLRVASKFGIPFSKYNQTIAAGKIGIGKVEKSHFYVTVLRGWDKKGTDSLSISPKDNLVAGAELQLTFWKQNIIIRGEGAVTQYTPDRYTYLADSTTWNRAAEKFPLLPKSTSSSYFSYAYTASAELHLFKGATNFYVEHKYIAPGYRSVGTPFLRNDLMRFEGRLDQRLAKNQIILSAFYRNDRDNLSNFKGITTKNNQFGATADFKFKKAPFIRIQYTPVFMENNMGKYILHVATANSGYQYNIKKVPLCTNVSYVTSIATSGLAQYNYQSHCLTINQSVSFSLPLMISVSYSLNHLKVNGAKQVINGVDVVSSFTLAKRIVNTVCINYYHRSDHGGNVGCSYDVSTNFLKVMFAGVRIDYNNMKDKLEVNNAFNEFVGRARIGFNF